MRRRSPATALSEVNMEKDQRKSQHSRICMLASLSAFFWLGLIYFHFVVLGGSSVIDHSIQQLTPFSMNTESSSNKNSAHPHTQTNPSPSLLTSPPKNSGPQSRSSDSGNAPPKPLVTPILTNSSKDSEKEQPVTGPRPDNASNKVENYPFMRALRTVENKSDPCGGRYVYVHELPPRFNEDMIKECKTLSLWTNMCKFISNAGLGPPLENIEGVFSNTGWYATNQFAVDVIFNNRMKQYDCVTGDSSLAAAIFVPFYAGFDIARYLWGYNTSMRDAASLDLLDWLTKKPEWSIMGGKDHFLVAGRITWDFRRKTDENSDWGNKLLRLPAAKNMSMLMVEASPWSFIDFGIPYPTYFHPAKDEDMFIWQDRMRKTERKWLFCFAGARRPGDHKSIRDQIIDQCQRSEVCKLLECSLGDSKCQSPSSIMQMFQSSIFCLQPQGDSYTRRSAFDAILAGCIPVFFHPASAYTQYTWHLPKNISKFSVLIPENDVRKNNINIEQWLRRYTPDQIREMGEEVIKLIPRITYADPRYKLETVKDAFDVAMEGIINQITKLRRDMVQGYRDDDRNEEVAWKYSMLEEGQHDVGPHEWDPFFVVEGDDTSNISSSSGNAGKKSWKIEHGEQ